MFYRSGWIQQKHKNPFPKYHGVEFSVNLTSLEFPHKYPAFFLIHGIELPSKRRLHQEIDGLLAVVGLIQPHSITKVGCFWCMNVLAVHEMFLGFEKQEFKTAVPPDDEVWVRHEEDVLLLGHTLHSWAKAHMIAVESCDLCLASSSSRFCSLFQRFHSARLLVSSCRVDELRNVQLYFVSSWECSAHNRWFQHIWQPLGTSMYFNRC